MKLPWRFGMFQLEAPLSAVFVGVGGIDLEPPAEMTVGNEHIVRTYAGPDADTSVCLRQPPELTGFSALATVEIQGGQHADRAFQLASIIAFLPADLLAVLATGHPESDRRLMAVRILSQTLPSLTTPRQQGAASSAIRAATRDTEAHIARFAATVARSLELPEGEPGGPLLLPMVTLEPIEASVTRFRPSMRVRPVTAEESVFRRAGWEIVSPADDGTLVHLVERPEQRVACAAFTGPGTAAFALDLAACFRYLPVEMALEVARVATEPGFRAAAVRALQLLHAAGVRDDPVLTALALATVDPAAAVRTVLDT